MLSKFWVSKETHKSFEWKLLFCTIVIGLFCGVTSFSIWQTMIASFGLSFPTTISMILVGSIAFDIGWNRSGRTQLNRGKYLFVATVMLMVWMALFPELCRLLMTTFSMLSAETFTNDISLMIPVFCITAILFSLPCYLMGAIPVLLTRVMLSSDSQEENSKAEVATTVNSIFFGSFTFGLFLNLYILSPMLGHYFAGMGTGLLLGLIYLTILFFMIKQNESAMKGQDPVIQLSQFDVRILNSIIIGVTASVMSLVVNQFWPSFAHQIYSQIGMILLGLSAGFALNGWKKIKASSSLQFLTCYLLFILFLFPTCVNIVLKSNTVFQDSVQMMAFRTLAIGVFFFPLGVVWSSVTHSIENEKVFCLSKLNLFYLSVGYLGGKYLLSGMLKLETVLLGLVVLQIGMHSYHSWKVQLTFKKMSLSFIPAALCLVAVLFPHYSNQYSPQLSAKMLFSTKVLVASNQGVSKDLLDQIDEVRLVTTKNSWFGTSTLWKNYGAQFQLRQNGYPVGVASSHPKAFPQHSGEVFRAIFPLIMHESPESVLIQGNGTGIPLQTVLSFPVQHVKCLEEDPALLDLMKTEIWQGNDESFTQDQRVEIQNVNPYLMTLLNGDKYDVIIANPQESSLLKMSSSFTTEFYDSVNQRLNDDGVFCQYFRAVEYGKVPVEGFFKTFQSAFNESIAVEVAANEYLLLGTNSDAGLVKKDLIKRLQVNHVRDVLSQIGWDWSVPLSLRVYQLDKMEFDKAITNNSIRNNWFAFTFPQEVVRWGNKQKEIADSLASSSIRVVDMPGLDNQDPQIMRRMKEVVSQFQILSKNPDRSVAYRKVLKKQLMNPRLAMIQPVSYENTNDKELHPIEERRKSYFKALGNAVEKRKPGLGLIQNVADHMEPYDPLITYFAHHEVADLLKRTGDDPAYELQCRLHMVYYSNSHDYSVRNIIAAMNLLVEHSDVVDSKEERVDFLNGLLQQLKYRWELRSHSPELKPEIALNDVNYSVGAIDQSFAKIEEILPVKNFSKNDWKNRRKFLEKNLVRPLHTYRTQILPKHQRRKSRIDNQKINNTIKEELELLNNQ